MANGSTSNLNLTKPEVGADTDAWGGHLNGNLDALDAMLAGSIYGLTLSTAGSSSTFGIAAGGASGMALSSAYTKTTGAWSVGSGNGSLDTGTIANSTWYHVWLIQRTDTGVVDILTSLSATSPTMPTNYTRKRRIGAMKTDASAHWKAFNQRGDEFLWAAVVVDVNSVTIGTSTLTPTLSVPTGIEVDAIIDMAGIGGTSGINYLAAVSPDQAAQTPGFGYSQCSWNATGGVDVGSCGQIHIRTNTSAQLQFTAGQASTAYAVTTRGWIDPRGRF
jgi:hypothetical protein